MGTSLAAFLTNEPPSESTAAQATAVMDAAGFVEGIKEDSAASPTEGAVDEARGIALDGEAATMAEVVFGRSHAESVDSTLPTTVHVVTIRVVHRGVDSLSAIRLVVGEVAEVVGIQEACVRFHLALIALRTGREHR